MRITDSGTNDHEFFQLFQRSPTEIILTLASGEKITGSKWVLFREYLTLDGVEVTYMSIDAWTAQVDLGRPCGQYLTQESDSADWSDWEQRNDIQWFIDGLFEGREGRHVLLELGDTLGETGASGKIHSVCADTITLAGGDISVSRKKVTWVCHQVHDLNPFDPKDWVRD